MAPLKSPRDSSGFMRLPVVQDIAVFVVVAISFWAAFQSQSTSNEVQKVQSRQDQVVTCTREYLLKTIEALNQRTTYTLAQATTNVELQQAQAAYLRIFFEHPPPTNPMAKRALKTYYLAVANFVDANQKAQKKIRNNPFPTSKEVTRCLSR